MFSFFARPYPFDTSIRRRILVSAGVSSFVFLFLFLFQPFGLSEYTGSIFKLTLGYGFVSFTVMLAINLVILFAFPAYFREEKWTTGREILWFMVMFGLIGIGNSIYTAFIYQGILALSWKYILIFEGYTLAVGIFPVSLSVIVNQVRLSSSFEKTSSEINALMKNKNEKTHQLHSHLQYNGDERLSSSESSKSNDPETKDMLIAIPAENGKDRFEVKKSQLLFIKSADNYVEVFYRSGNQTRCELIRTTLKKCEELLAGPADFFRCHKSFLVHLEKVNRVSGNAQGYKLHLTESDEVVPVSRAHNETIKMKLANRP